MWLSKVGVCRWGTIRFKIITKHVLVPPTLCMYLAQFTCLFIFWYTYLSIWSMQFSLHWYICSYIYERHVFDEIYKRNALPFDSSRHARSRSKNTLAKWDVLCRPKDQDWLGIENLQIENKFLLGKWLHKLLSDVGIWQELLQKKYFCSKMLFQMDVNPKASPFWTILIKAKFYFFLRSSSKFVLRGDVLLRMFR